MIGIKSITSGRILPCTRIKESLWRYLCYMPYVLVEAKLTGLSGSITSRHWVREADILDIPDPEVEEDVSLDWEDLLMKVIWSGIFTKVKAGGKLTENQQIMYDQYLLDKDAERD